MEIDDIWSDDEDREQFSRPTDPQPQEPAGCGPNMKGMESHGPDYVAMLEPMLSCGPSLEPAAWMHCHYDAYVTTRHEGPYTRPLYSADTIAALTKERDGWIDSAKHFCTGMEYYRDLIDQAAKHIGLPMYTADDQGVHLEPLRAKLPECVAALQAELSEAKAYNAGRTDELIAATRQNNELQAENTELRKDAERKNVALKRAKGRIQGLSASIFGEEKKDRCEYIDAAMKEEK